MLSGKSGVTLSTWRVVLGAVAAAAALTACHGKVRRFPKDLQEVEASNQPNAATATTNASGPSMDPSDRSPEGQQDPGGLDGDQSDEQQACSGDGDAGCPPNSFCSPDAGVVCEATCPGCLIEGECVAADQLEPDTSCRVCDPDRNPRGWSPNDGVTCDDGLFCTVDDVCSAGACGGGPRVCEDGVACNGLSTCSETTRSCSPDVNGCGNNALCNLQTDSCVSTCAGCVIDSVCVGAGVESSGNPCLVCDPTRSAIAYTAAAGKLCGAGATGCSQQDTCDGQARCQPNHLPANTACGSPASSACDQPDSCDGNGNCQQRGAGNGTGCNDGAFCTVGDQCQGGQCVPTGNQNCGANRICNETTDQCQCQGCQIGNTCVGSGAVNISNPCQVCDPVRSAAAYSANGGARCGSGATECSAQDTCNAQGQCAANNLANGMPCTSVPRGSCQNGACVAATLPAGSSCTQDSECSSARCETWYQDLDGDGFGTDAVVQRICGSANGLSVPPNSYVRTGGDCCDVGGAARVQAVQVFPGQTQFFDVPQGSCPDVGAFDYDCSEDVEYLFQEATERGGGGCAFAGCSGVTVWALAEMGGSPPSCGGIGVLNSCVSIGGTCNVQPQGRDVNFCH